MDKTKLRLAYMRAITSAIKEIVNSDFLSADAKVKLVVALQAQERKALEALCKE